MNKTKADLVFEYPIAYLAAFGITAELIEVESPLPAAA
jgi:hypothetical protein